MAAITMPIPSFSDSDDDEETLTGQRRPVKLEIQTLIAPYKNRTTEPPFSAAELIVMAVLCSNQNALDKKDILLWITSTFRYYTRLALEEFAEGQARDPGFQFDWLPHEPYKTEDVVEGLPDAFNELDAPLVDADEYSTICAINCNAVTVPVGAGRVFLRHLLEPKR